MIKPFLNSKVNKGKALSYISAFILLFFLLIHDKVAACDAEIISVSSSQICSYDSVRVKIKLHGTPLWKISYRAGIKMYTISGIDTEIYEFDLSADKFGVSGIQRIQLISSSDAVSGGSVDTTSFFVNIIATAEPSGDDFQEFCASVSPLVSDLVLAGSSIKWYASESEGTLMQMSESLSSGTFWASQTIAGCESENRFRVDVEIHDPDAPTGDAFQVVCTDEIRTISALSATGTAIKWYFTSTDGTNISPDATISSGLYWASQTINGCESTERMQVDLILSPLPKPDLGPDTALCYGNILALDPGIFSSYQWSTGETVPILTITEGIGAVSVTVTDENGCTGSDEVIVNPCDPELLLGQIPNLFTPNGDGYHDTWEIENIGLFPYCNIKVFDRGGRLVYESRNGYGNDWNGRGLNGNVLPPATYYYIIDLNIPGIDPFTGTVTILR